MDFIIFQKRSPFHNSLLLHLLMQILFSSFPHGHNTYSPLQFYFQMLEFLPWIRHFGNQTWKNLIAVKNTFDALYGKLQEECLVQMISYFKLGKDKHLKSHGKTIFQQFLEVGNFSLCGWIIQTGCFEFGRNGVILTIDFQIFFANLLIFSVLVWWQKPWMCSTFALYDTAEGK